MVRTFRIAAGIMFLGIAAGSARAQTAQPANDADRVQYPVLLQNAYVAFEPGYIDEPFSAAQVEPTFHAASVASPHAAVRVAIFGRELTPDLAIQATYMRPVEWVKYTDINGDRVAHSVWTQFAGLTLRARVPLHGRTAVYGEAGLGLTSRHGFMVNRAQVVSDAHYASVLAGGGVEYAISKAWALSAGLTYSPSNARVQEPRAMLASAGVRYTIRPLPPERVEAIAHESAFFPRQLVAVEISTPYGYGISRFTSKTVPIFWNGTVQIDRGVAVHYERNVFHTARLFSFDLGVSVSTWRSRLDHDRPSTLSAYPLFRFTVLRMREADVYLCYSLAGPTVISRVVVDGLDTGHHFTFQDFMGAGAFVGPGRHIAVGVKVNHYSNGNLFTENPGLTIPITFTVGYAF